MDLSTICPLTVDAALARAAATAPDVEAIVADDGRLTFAQVADRVAQLRSALVAAGVRRGDHIGLCIGNRVAFHTMFLALGTIGAVTVPVNTRFRAEEMAYALRQSRVSMLFLADRFLRIDFVDMLRSICPAIDTALPDAAMPDLMRVVVLGEDVPGAAMSLDDFLAAGTVPAAPTCAPDDILLMQYTSGTTSFPKGVMLRQRSMLANAWFSGGRMGLRIGDRYHSARPFFHVAGSTLSILSSLQHMVTLVSMDRFEGDKALALMERERCTHFSGNDTMALMLLNDPSLPQRKLCLRGAWAAASPAVMRRIVDELGAVEAVAGYGLSEASPNIAQSAWWEPEDVRVASLMRPQPGVEVRIVGEDGTDLPIGERGEIAVRGWNVMAGYYDKPEETAETLTQDGWLSTGDLGTLDAEGRLQFLGRAKDIVRVGGENVAPAEIEDILHRHPAIRQAAVIGVPDPRLMEVIGAFVIANEGAQTDEGAVIDWCKDNMAGFKVPRHVWFVPDFEAIGMTASSKVQKKPLAEHARRLLGIEA
ncbi:AMP-binding protein [Novosphingobium sp. AP12]|uniref:AMP-binding protein n=1 Tax=Novosphingobium sp. AP12 TaxID=1144305 RepID=UPI0002720FDD|nr:AMP-binding protein [Novosphingobium sp. AP12]EJL30473.1 acyl-CoA synthetase (AMP-forming)/AMP-acid ligase II [Novosphingobium sp. AP12]